MRSESWKKRSYPFFPELRDWRRKGAGLRLLLFAIQRAVERLQAPPLLAPTSYWGNSSQSGGPARDFLFLSQFISTYWWSSTTSRYNSSCWEGLSLRFFGIPLQTTTYDGSPKCCYSMEYLRSFCEHSWPSWGSITWQVLTGMLIFSWSCPFKEIWVLLFYSVPGSHQDLELNNIFNNWERENLGAGSWERWTGHQNGSFGGLSLGREKKNGTVVWEEGGGESGAQSLLGLAAPACNSWEGGVPWSQRPVNWENGLEKTLWCSVKGLLGDGDGGASRML